MSGQWKRKLVGKLRGYLASGLLFWVPVYMTLLVIKFIMGGLNNTLKWLPNAYHPEAIFEVSYTGALATLLIILFTGWVSNKFILGERFVNYWDFLMNSVPLFGTVHTATKKMLHPFFSGQTGPAAHAYLVEFPRKGMWSIGFQIGKGLPSCENKLPLFIWMTPNITAGFLILVAKEDAVPLNMGLEDAVKYVVSLGLIEKR